MKIKDYLLSFIGDLAMPIMGANQKIKLIMKNKITAILSHSVYAGYRIVRSLHEPMLRAKTTIIPQTIKAHSLVSDSLLINPIYHILTGCQVK